MADRLADRFRNLERPRRPGEVDTVPDPDQRIGGIEPAGQVAAGQSATGRRGPAASSAAPAQAAPRATPSVAPSHVDRFRPAAEPALDTAREDEGAQPFRRCLRCETDNSPFARTCTTCDADLDTPEQQRFNERLWAERQKEKALEEREAAVRERERELTAANAEQARREAATELARQIGDRERARLDRELGGWGRDGSRWDDWDGRDRTPYGVRMLRKIRSPAWRIGVVVALVAVPLLLLVFGGRHANARFAGFAGLFLLAGLFSPPGYRYRRRWYWDD